MCPSYRATLDEKHCTRGRAHLLFEMFTADEHKVDWRNEEVKESLDLCLACKGCKSDCPVRVDVATYKAEFLSHYYKGRFRPRSAYAMGLIDQWCRLGKFVPRLANAISSLPLSSNLFKWLGGLAQERDVPRFAAQTFKKWHKKHSRSSGRGQEILLWADTFSNHFMPDIARDANYVLEELGYKTIVPSAHLCCGRPLYDFGMLDAAKSYLEKILKHLKPIIDRGTPIVGLEPSCLVVFKDELLNLFPENEDARRLSESVQTFAQFLLSEGREKDLPKIRDRVVVHGHCQQKAVIGLENESRLLKALGADFEILDSGCCGMAGSFGFEKDKYEISSRIGELSLLPRVRSESEATVILADGFSCREQIGQKTGRKALHIAQLLANSMKAGLSPEANRGDSTL